MDSGLTEGEIECSLRVKKCRNEKGCKYRVRAMARWLSCIWFFPRLLVAICSSRQPNFSSPSSALYLDPYNAEDMDMRWAFVLVAQVFPHWQQDIKKSGMSDMSSSDALSEQLSRFRRGILCSAAHHVRSRIDDAVMDGDPASDIGLSGKSRFGLDECQKYPKLCSDDFHCKSFLKLPVRLEWDVRLARHT